MTHTPERTPSSVSYRRGAAPIVRDGLRLTDKIKRLEQLSSETADTAPIGETSPATSPTPIEVAFIATPGDMVTVSHTREDTTGTERISPVRRLALGARALSGSLIERFGSPTGPRHRARRIGMAGLDAFRSTGGSHKHVPGAHKAVAIRPGKHRA